ncbi:MAG: hypothetical protein QM770_23500 [Tepidisphaeraceae bacterium]
MKPDDAVALIGELLKLEPLSSTYRNQFSDQLNEIRSGRGKQNHLTRPSLLDNDVARA